MPLRLQWSRTWPDSHEDFVCHAEGVVGSVGRIYSDTQPGTLKKRWRWATHGHLPDRKIWMSQSGFAATKDEAAHAVEAAYFEILSGKNEAR